MKHELSELEAEFPSLITPDSPTQRVAGAPKEELGKVRHKVRQWSLNDCFSPEEFLAFDERVKKILSKGASQKVEYVCEHKIDGLKIVFVLDTSLNADVPASTATNDDMCFSVAVLKIADTSSVVSASGTTIIESRGYNTCNPNAANRFERAIRTVNQ